MDEHKRERGEHNELGYRNVDEDATYDERGSQGPGGREDADEKTRSKTAEEGQEPGHH
jgi:hypothetical protein